MHFKKCCHGLEQWLNSDFETGKLISLERKKLQAAARDSLKRRHETHIGIQHGALTSEVAGGASKCKLLTPIVTQVTVRANPCG